MINYFIEDLDDAQELVSVCRKFDGDIDVICGRYVVDGKSALAVCSLVGRTVGVDMIAAEESDKEKLENMLKELK